MLTSRALSYICIPYGITRQGLLYDLVDLGRQLHQEALDVGWTQAEVQIALSDGAVCLEKFLATYFPRAVLILDFWHAAEHLAELARTLHPQEEACREKLGQWCTTMKHQGGAAVLAALEQLDQTFVVGRGSGGVAARNQLPPQQRLTHGLSPLLGGWLAHRQRTDRGRMQNRHRCPHERRRHALGRRRNSHRRHATCMLPERTYTMG